MSGLENLFRSPEWYPLTVDFKRQVLTFIRLAPESYQDYVFLATKAAQRRETDFYQVRLDDVLFAAANTPPATARVHYILHTAYCCSTLLARYFELLPGCVVLKEPQMLAQIAEAEGRAPQWQEAFDLAARLLARTYQPQDMAVIKTHVPCNTLAQKLLDQNKDATISFLMPPLRGFLLAVLKSKDRRSRVRFWCRHLARIAAKPPELAEIDPAVLTEGENAAYWWMVNRYLCGQLASQAQNTRVLVLDADRVADSPKETMISLAALCGLKLTKDQLDFITSHPRVHRYSKDLSRPYDAAVRQLEIDELEKCWGSEADAAMEWILSRGMTCDFSNSSATEHPLMSAARSRAHK